MIALMSDVILAREYDLSAAVRYFELGYNLYEVCQKLEWNREDFVAWVKADDARFARVTEARRQGADCLIATYKDKLMQELKIAEDQRDRISILKEIGTHIRWEASAIHNGSYAPKTAVEHSGKVSGFPQLTLTDEQVREMAKEVLAKPGESLAKPEPDAGS